MDPKTFRHSLVGQARHWEKKRRFQIEFLINHGLNSSDRLLDIGCGTLRGGIPIIDYLDESGYTGIDVRSYVIKEARKELRSEKLEGKKPILLHFKEFDGLELVDGFDVIFAFSVLIHLTDEILEKTFRFVKDQLNKDGSFFANVLVGEGIGKWDQFPVVSRQLDHYRQLAEINSLTMDVLGKLGELGHNSGDELQDNQLMLRFAH